MDNKPLETWMFRVPFEHLSLLFSLFLLCLLSYLFSSINLYIFFILIFIALIYVKLQQAQYLGNAIRVYENQFPELFLTFKEHAIKLNLPKSALYITQDPTLNAYTLGISYCTVILTSALVEQLNNEELSFVIAHELGHFKAGHTKISSLLIPLNGNLLSNFIFGFWQRKTEYTADRCGLAVTKDLDSALTGLIKLAIGKSLYEKFNLKGYLPQLKKAEGTSLKLSEMLLDHPFITNRIKALYIFYKDSFQKNT